MPCPHSARTVADIAHAIALFRNVKCCKEALLGHVDQALRLFADLADRRGERAVGLPAIQDQSRIDRYDLTLFKHSTLGRNSMHDLTVNRRADRSGIPFVVQEGRNGPVGTNELFRKAVKLIRCNPGFDLSLKLRKHVMEHRSRLTHLLYLGRILDRDHLSAPSALRISVKHTSIG